jgi:hypothetical protein
MVICIIGGTVANADLILTVDGENPTGVPLMLQGTGPYTIILDGNTPIEPNDVRFEVITGTLTAIPDTNHQYIFQYEGESTTGLIRLIANIDMTIDGFWAPAGMTIYELFVFCNPEFEFTGACGSDITVFIPFEGEESEQEESFVEKQEEQSAINTEGKTFTGEMNDFSYTEASYDPSMDLNYDGKIDFLDFSILGDYWTTIYDIYDLDTMCASWSINCCDDINLPDPTDPGNWDYVTFYGIGSCPEIPGYCEYAEGHGMWDNCNHLVFVTCEEDEWNLSCNYNFWFSGLRIGRCVYLCGQNYVQVLKNSGGCRILRTRHLVHDTFETWACDEGTPGKIDWQVFDFNCVSGGNVHYCREGKLSRLSLKFMQSVTAS